MLQFLAATDCWIEGLKIRTLMLPDRFIDQDKPRAMYEQAGLDARRHRRRGVRGARQGFREPLRSSRFAK